MRKKRTIFLLNAILFATSIATPYFLEQNLSLQEVFLYPMCLAVIPGIVETFSIGDDSVNKYAAWISTLSIILGYSIGVHFLNSTSDIAVSMLFGFLPTATYEGVIYGYSIGMMMSFPLIFAWRHIKNFFEALIVLKDELQAESACY